MSKQTSLHPDERQEPLRSGKKPKRDRPWVLQQRIREDSGIVRRRFMNWWTSGRYETEAKAQIVADKIAREFVRYEPKLPTWETRIFHRDNPPDEEADD